MRLTSSTVVAALLLLTVSSPTKAQDVVYGDRFTYGPTVTREDGFLDYAPNAWINIDCDETSREGLDACLGYTDKWHTGEDWTLEKNYCLHCPADEPIPEEGPCSRHHQSPINLERNVGLGYWNKTEVNAGDPGVGAHPNANECIDIHWMKYEVRIAELFIALWEETNDR